MGAITKSKYFDPRCCLYKLSGKIRKHVTELIESKDIEEDTKSILIDIIEKEESDKNTLTYDSLVKLHKFIQRADRDYIEPFWLFSEDCKCIEPKPRANIQLDERLRQLRLRTSQAMYNNMTQSVDRQVERELEKLQDSSEGGKSTSRVYSINNDNNSDNIGQTGLSEFKKLNGSIVAVFNSFLVFICTFIFCYKALEYSLDEPNIIAQVSFGLGGSTLVAIAELYFLLRVV